MASLWRMRSGRISRIDTTTFSVVFVVVLALVLITGLAASSMHCFDEITVSLPHVYFAVPLRGAEHENTIQVIVMRDGTVILGPEKLPPHEIAAKIQDLVKNGAERKAYIEADARAPYGVVKQVLSGVHDGGIQDVAFFVEKRSIM
jgi:biopolymer transport protein TolR